MPNQTFHFAQHVWSIDDIDQLLAGRLPNGVLDVESAYQTGHTLGVHINEDHLNSGNVVLTKPVYVVTVPEHTGVLVIDGWHRVNLAHRQGIKTLPYYQLTPEEEAQVKLRGPEQSYYAAPVIFAPPRRNPFARPRPTEEPPESGE